MAKLNFYFFSTQVFKAPTNNNVSSLNNNNNPFLGDLQKKLFPGKAESVGHPDIDDIEGLSDEDDEDLEIKSDSPIRVS